MMNISILQLFIFLLIVNSGQHVFGENVTPTCENVEVFITNNNYNTYVCNDFNKSWKSTMLNGTFSYIGSANRKVLLYQGLVGSKINYRFATCSSATSTPNYSILINDFNAMKYPYLNPSLYCNTKDACNLGFSKASVSDIPSLSYLYLKDYSNKMTFKRPTSEELLIQSMYLYLCYVPSTTPVIDLGIPSKPSSLVITSKQSNRNSSNVVTLKNSGVDTITDLSLDIKFETLSISNLNISIVKLVRIFHSNNTQSIIKSPFTLTQVSGSNTATIALPSINLMNNQSIQATVMYTWRTESTITTNTTSIITYSTSTNVKCFDPMVSSKTQTSSITLSYLFNSNSSISNNSVSSNSTKSSNTTTSNNIIPISNSTIVVDPNTSNTYYEEYEKALSFKVDNSKRVIISTHVATATNCYVQTYLKFSTTFNGSVVVTSTATSKAITIPQISMSNSTLLIPPSLLNCGVGGYTILTLKIINSKTTNTSGTITMLKKSIKSMTIDQSFVVPKPVIDGEVNALTITGYSSRDNTPQDITMSTSSLSIKPFYLFILQNGEMPSSLDLSKANQFIASTNTYNHKLSFKQLPIGSLVILVENNCETCSATLSFTIPTLYSNPTSLAVDTVSSQSFSQSTTGTYPYFISYTPTESKSYLFALVTIQNLQPLITPYDVTLRPPNLQLTATQGTLQRSISAFTKTVTVNCQNENTNVVGISTWIQPSTNGVWKFNLKLDPVYTNANTKIDYVLKSISATQLAFSITPSYSIIQFPYYTPPTEDVIQRMVINSASNNFQITIVLDNQNLLLTNGKFTVYLAVGYAPSSLYDLAIDFSSQRNYNVKIISFDRGIIIENGNNKVFVSTTFSKLQDKAIYLRIHPEEPSLMQSCDFSSFYSQAKLSYLMTSTPTMVTISSTSYLNKFNVNPGTIIDVDFSNANETGNYFIELFSQQYTSLPTPTVYGVGSSVLQTIPITRKDIVYKQYQTSMKAVKFITEFDASKLKQYSKIFIQFSNDNSFSTASFRGTGENIYSEELVYIEKYFFESYITAGCIIGILILYSLLFICVFCAQTIRKKKINIDNEKEWESFIPALFATLPMFLAIRVCRGCIKSKDERENRYCSVFAVGTTILVLGIAWLVGFGSIVGITIFETVGLMQFDSVEMVLSKSAYACCKVQTGTYIDNVYSDFEMVNLANTFKCVNVPSASSHITDFFVNSATPQTPLDISDIEGGLTAVGWTNLHCKGSKILYVPEKFELARYLCIVLTFSLFLLGSATWFYIFLIIACIQAPKRKKNAIKAPSSSSSKSIKSNTGKPIDKRQKSMHKQGTNGIPQQSLNRNQSVHRSPTSPTKATHTFADYDVFFPEKDSNTPLNKRRNEYEMFDVPILNTPPPVYTPHPTSPRSPTQIAFTTSPRSPTQMPVSAYYTYEPTTYGVNAFGNINSPVQNGMLPPPPPYSTIVLPPVQESNYDTYHDDNLEGLTIPTPEALKMTSQ